MFVLRKILNSNFKLKMQEVFLPHMFDVFKNQFKSNLQQDILALGGFMTEQEILSTLEKCIEIARNQGLKAENKDEKN